MSLLGWLAVLVWFAALFGATAWAAWPRDLKRRSLGR